MEVMPEKMNRAIFIDKDGTLIKNVPYSIDPALIELENDAGVALQMLKENDYLIIVVSNQSGVAYGYFIESDLESEKSNTVLIAKTKCCDRCFLLLPASSRR
jgi:D-glycero-D-manno-heptose 1,7-bisphosphate phosphatase